MPIAPSPAFIADGMNLAVKNAKRLYNDAKLLFDSGSFPTSASLAALSIEESGKVAILREIALARNAKELKNGWRAYRSHRDKNLAWLLPDLVSSGARTLDELFSLVDPNSSHTAVLDQFKQAGFYSDCALEKVWTDPTVVINRQLAQTILLSAASLLSRRTHTAKEIELWISHVGPVWKADMQSMKTALLSWQHAMVKEGLTIEGSPTMEAFLFGASSGEG